MADAAKVTKSSDTLSSIEELQKKLGTSDSIHEAVKAANGWRKGKVLKEEEYKKAIEEFLKAPMSGIKKDKDSNVKEGEKKRC